MCMYLYICLIAFSPHSHTRSYIYIYIVHIYTNYTCPCTPAQMNPLVSFSYLTIPYLILSYLILFIFLYFRTLPNLAYILLPQPVRTVYCVLYLPGPAATGAVGALGGVRHLPGLLRRAGAGDPRAAVPSPRPPLPAVRLTSALCHVHLPCCRGYIKCSGRRGMRYVICESTSRWSRLSTQHQH
jgi:hypothetical protein